MAPKRKAICAPYHRNLISFIPGTEAYSVSNNGHATVKASHSHCQYETQGHEVKSFYENLLSQDIGHDQAKIPVAWTKGPNTQIGKSSDSWCAETPKTNKQSSDSSSGGKHLKVNSIGDTDAGSSSGTDSSVSSSNTSPQTERVNFSQFNPKVRQHFKLLQHAQLGDLSDLKDLLNGKNRSDLDVNLTDFYGWTPLMCAAKEGHVSVVKFFLKYGANRYTCNLSGDTALSIARSAGHLSVVSILESYEDGLHNRVKNQSGNHDSSSEPYHCAVCKRDFSQDDKTNHLTSTVHLFNSGHCSNAPSYFIPNSNRGFQMLLRGGWDAQSGLGPEGKGRKYPVKTVLKQDRAGLGGEHEKRKKAKVTHFSGGDTGAVKNKTIPDRLMSVRKAARNAAKSKERRDRRWEQNLRFEMS